MPGQPGSFLLLVFLSLASGFQVNLDEEQGDQQPGLLDSLTEEEQAALGISNADLAELHELSKDIAFNQADMERIADYIGAMNDEELEQLSEMNVEALDELEEKVKKRLTKPAEEDTDAILSRKRRGLRLSLGFNLGGRRRGRRGRRGRGRLGRARLGRYGSDPLVVVEGGRGRGYRRGGLLGGRGRRRSRPGLGLSAGLGLRFRRSADSVERELAVPATHEGSRRKRHVESALRMLGLSTEDTKVEDTELIYLTAQLDGKLHETESTVGKSV